MNDQVGVSMPDRGKHLKHETDAVRVSEAALPGKGIDGLPLDVLQHQVRLAGSAETGIQQLRDARMG